MPLKTLIVDFSAPPTFCAASIGIFNQESRCRTSGILEGEVSLRKAGVWKESRRQAAIDWDDVLLMGFNDIILPVGPDHAGHYYFGKRLQFSFLFLFSRSLISMVTLVLLNNSGTHLEYFNTFLAQARFHFPKKASLDNTPSRVSMRPRDATRALLAGPLL